MMKWLLDVKIGDILKLPLYIVLGIILIPIIIVVLIWDIIRDKFLLKNKEKKDE